MNLALFAADGRKLAERPDLLLTDAVTTLRFEGLAEAPILSLNRGFAAPVVAGPRPPREALAVLARHEDDPFARYEALQQLMLSALVASIASGHPDGHADVVAAVAAALDRWTDDPAFTGEAILVPSEGLIADQFERVNPAEVHAAREALRESLRAALKDRLAPLWPATETAGEDCSPRAKGLRRLRAILISLLAAGDDPDGVAAAFAQFEAARSMTDRMSALVALSHSRRPARDRALAAFHRRYHRIPECLDKWFLTQAASTRPDTRVVVERLASHAEFDPVNPNRLRALVLGFAMNPARFHDPEGQGYHLLARHVLDADRFNPQSAARLVQPLTRWRRLVPPYGSAMRDTLERVAAAPGLSKDVTEVVTTGLR
jgi:aminopeptidase N